MICSVQPLRKLHMLLVYDGNFEVPLMDDLADSVRLVDDLLGQGGGR